MTKSTVRFTPEFVKALNKWITHVAAWLEIRDWEIVLLDAPPDDKDAAASMDCTYGKKRANLQLAHDFFMYRPDLQEHYLIHELCHIVHDNVDKVIEDQGLSLILGKPAYTILERMYVLQMEVFTDTFACIVVEMFKDGQRYHKLFKEMLEAEHRPALLAD